MISLVTELLKQCLSAETAVPDALHNRLRQLLQYTVVGGMPDVVQCFVKYKNMNEVLQVQRDIVNSYKDDMVKHVRNADKGKIRDCFESIPKQLSKENKKYQYSVIKKGANAAQYLGCLQWIEDAGIIQPTHESEIRHGSRKEKIRRQKRSKKSARTGPDAVLHGSEAGTAGK